MIKRFESMPSVKVYGILRAEIRIQETNKLERIVRTKWDDIRADNNSIRILQIEEEIEKLNSELNFLR